MAKRVRYCKLVLENGDTKVIQVKTTTENYIRKVIADMCLPGKVIKWVVI